MGAQQSANATVPPAAPEPDHHASTSSSYPRTDVHVPDKPSTPIQSSLAAQAGGGDGNSRVGGGQVNEERKKLKACCACPETKKIRDECIMENGEDNCQHFIEAHKACMRSLGFNI